MLIKFLTLPDLGLVRDEVVVGGTALEPRHVLLQLLRPARVLQRSSSSWDSAYHQHRASASPIAARNAVRDSAGSPAASLANLARVVLDPAVGVQQADLAQRRLDLPGLLPAQVDGALAEEVGCDGTLGHLHRYREGRMEGGN